MALIPRTAISHPAHNTRFKMQQPILNLEERHSLATQRTRLYTKPSPGHPNGHGLFAGLPTRPPRKRLPKPVETLRPGLTPWLNDCKLFGQQAFPAP